MIRRLPTLLFVGALLAAGCESDDASAPAPEGAGGGRSDAAGSASGADGSAAGVPEPSEPESGAEQDATSSPDPELEPEVIPELEVPVAADEPKAFAFLQDPSSEGFTPTEVQLVRPTSEDGSLLGPYAEVRNCLNEEGGEPLAGGFGALCHEVHTAFPGPGGHYTHIQPPATYLDPDDPFAEVMMYHHMHVAHAYFHDVHGLTELDFPLYSLVNVQMYIELFGGWQPFPNAAFIPEEGFEGFGLPAKPGGAIVFGQVQNTDLAYDASVIYHEYTHAMIGTTRLSGILADIQGLDGMPGAMNEGFADYFATSMTGSPLIGAYALAFAGPQYLRDLSEARRCPDDLFGEVHVDGKIIGSALWAVREALGQTMTDGIVLRALQSFTNYTNLGIAAELMLAESELEGAEVAETVEAIFEDFGLLDCQRTKPWEAFHQNDNTDQLPYFVQGTQGATGAQMPDGAPAFFQFHVDVPDGTAAIELSWRAESQGGLGGFGGGGGLAQLDLAVRKSEPVAFNYLLGGTIDADAILEAPKHTAPGKTDWRAVTLEASCLPAWGERLHLMMLNQQSGQAMITDMDIVLRDDLEGAVNKVGCGS